MTTVKKSFFRSKLPMAICFAALVFLMSACLDDDDNNVTPVPVAYVSLYHASPNTPDLDIVVDGKRINTSPFEYTDYSHYLQFRTGDRTLQFNPVNASNALAETTVSLEEDKAYSLFLIKDANNVGTLLVRDSSGVPSSGKAMVRIAHLSPDAPAVDLAVQGDEGTPLFVNQTFKQVSGFKEVDADNYTFEIEGTGDGQVSLTLPSVQLIAGRVYTIVVRGFATPPTGNTDVLSAQVLAN